MCQAYICLEWQMWFAAVQRCKRCYCACYHNVRCLMSQWVFWGPCAPRVCLLNAFEQLWQGASCWHSVPAHGVAANFVLLRSQLLGQSGCLPPMRVIGSMILMSECDEQVRHCMFAYDQQVLRSASLTPPFAVSLVHTSKNYHASFQDDADILRVQSVAHVRDCFP